MSSPDSPRSNDISPPLRVDDKESLPKNANLETDLNYAVSQPGLKVITDLSKSPFGFTWEPPSSGPSLFSFVGLTLTYYGRYVTTFGCLPRYYFMAIWPPSRARIVAVAWAVILLSSLWGSSMVIWQSALAIYAAMGLYLLTCIRDHLKEDWRNLSVWSKALTKRISHLKSLLPPVADIQNGGVQQLDDDRQRLVRNLLPNLEATLTLVGHAIDRGDIIYGNTQNLF